MINLSFCDNNVKLVFEGRSGKKCQGVLKYDWNFLKNLTELENDVDSWIFLNFILIEN